MGILAAALAARHEWRHGFPDAEIVWVEEADEGRGIGFDGLDPSAMVRSYRRTPASWPEVLAWYRELLEARGWVGRMVKDDYWWEWTAPAHPGERFLLIDRSRVSHSPRPWAPEPGQLLFEVMLTALSDDQPGQPDA